MTRATLSFLVVWSLGCSSPPVRTVIDAVEVGDVVWSPPDAADGEQHVLLWMRSGASRRALAPRPSRAWIEGSAMRGHALARDDAHDLWELDAQGRAALVAVRVVSGPFVDLAGHTIAYVRASQTGTYELWVYDGVATRRLERSLAQAFAIRFDDRGERIVFAGARNGGWTGLWTVRVARGPARCLSNCDLRAGDPRNLSLTRPAADLDTLRVGVDSVSYVDEHGVATSLSYETTPLLPTSGVTTVRGTP